MSIHYNYYSEDYSKLDQSCSTDPHFLWHDIQMSKSKANKIFVEISGIVEKNWFIDVYHVLNGDKVCSQSDCDFVAPVTRLRSYWVPWSSRWYKLQWSNEMSSTKCPTEFAYIFPKDTNNGYVRQQKVPTKNLHNHSIPHGTKILRSFVNKAIFNNQQA